MRGDATLTRLLQPIEAALSHPQVTDICSIARTRCSSARTARGKT